MRNIERNKIAAIGLLMVLVIGFGQANGWLSPLEGDVDQEMYITGGYPKVGEVFEAVYRVRLKEENSLNKHPEKMVAMGYVIHFSSRPMDPVTFITEKEIFVPVLNPGEWREFSAKLRITKGATNIQIQAGTHFKASKSGAHGAMSIYLLNPETGQYGTKEEYDKQLRQKAEWWYDPAGEFTGDPVHPDCAKKNREIIAKMQEINSNLTDWEALYLHYDGIQALMGGMGTQETTDEERWRFLLEMGWLEQYKAGKAVKNKWLNKMIKKYESKPLTKEQGLNPDFFRGNSDNIDNNGSGSDSTQTRWSYIYFKGQFRHKKHKYNKDQGLLTQTDDMPICSVLVKVRSYWSGSGGSRWSFRTNTDNNGNFLATLSWEVPSNIWIRAHPLIYFWGPTPTNRVIKVSDPTPTSYLTWRDPIDTTIFLLPRVQGGVDSFFTSTDTFNFGTMYVDSFISGTNPQPKSGAANISQSYLHARTFMSPPPTRPLRVMWEPGHDAGTAMNMLYTAHNDTIWVKAVQDTNTDEWDDDVLLHEFGHYLIERICSRSTDLLRST